MQQRGQQHWLQHPEMMAAFGTPDMLGEFNKPAGQRCPFQKHGKGCACYARRPMGCRVWNCRWLVNNDTADLRRPDRSHYVIDIMPDYIRVNGEPKQVVQIWVDPDYPHAHRDPALRAYIERRGAEGIVALVRFNEYDGLLLVPPNMASDGQWHELSMTDPVPQGATWPEGLRNAATL
jgi:hypothetical protein